MKYAVKRVQRHQLFETCLCGCGRRVASVPFFVAAPWASVDALLVTIIVTIMASLNPRALRRVDRIGWRVREDATKLRGGLHPARTLDPLSLVLGLTPRWRIRVLSIAVIRYERNTKTRPLIFACGYIEKNPTWTMIEESPRLTICIV